MSITADHDDNSKSLIDLRINPDEKALWTAALDSGEYQQARSTLFNGVGYCCLGLYAKVKGCDFFYGTEIVEDEDDFGHTIEREREREDYSVEIDGASINDSELLEQSFADRAGISASHQRLLSHLNDGGEYALEQSAPMHAVVMALDFEHRRSPDEPGTTIFKFHKHTFAEISAIIKNHF